MRRTLPLFLIFALLLAACGLNPIGQTAATPVPPTATQPITNTPAPPATIAPSPTAPLPTVTATVPTVPVATLTAELSATVVAALPPTATTAPGKDAPLFGGIDAVDAKPLAVKAGSPPLWVVSSAGFPDLNRNQRHFVAIYTHSDGGWSELARHEIDNADALMAEGVTQVNISTDRIWLLVESGVGAHSGCLELLSFNEGALTKELSGCNSSPVAGFVQDLDGDGIDEIVLNQSDNYVFCYACGERFYSYEAYHWNGTKLQAIDFQASAPGKVGQPLHDAVVLARLGMWKDAQTVISQTTDLGTDPQAKLYAGVIGLHAQDFANQVQNAQFPLLDQLFYGDYDKALDVLRALPPEQLFAKPSPLITGTAAENWEGQVTYWITDTTTTLIDSNIGDSIDDLPIPARSIDTLAAAHFMRGWALTLSDPTSPNAIADIEQAVQLKPDDAFFKAALAYLKK